MKKGILIAFGEIFLKSRGVQEIFKGKLIGNISFFLKKSKINFKLFPQRERIFLETENLKKAKSVIKNVFGISWFAKSLFFEKESLKEVSEFVAKNYKNWIKKGESFAIRLKKGSEIEEKKDKIIDAIAKNIKRKVDLEKPKKEIFVEVRKEGFYLYFKKEKGPGGLPVGASGKVLTLISGGIDSPVAAYLMAKRGAENVWLHFHSFPLVSQKSIEKVKKLAQVFLKFQPKLKVYFFPFSKIQAQIRIKSPPKYRVLLYRRAMVKIAQSLAKKENAHALVTGESLGQVSSQTLPNLEIIEKAVSIPILRPLIGLNKEEIINLAKEIGSYEISILPQEDCCTLFTPKHATAKGNLKELLKIEKKLDLKEIIKSSKKEIQIIHF
jgi:thiamine biosynthesis protein ThiI